MGVEDFCDLSCKTGHPCPGGVVPWGPSPCELTEDEALKLVPPGTSIEADDARQRKEQHGLLS